MNLKTTEQFEDKMAKITNDPHLYVIFNRAEQPDEEHEISLVKVTEDRIVAAILSLFELIPSPEWRVECVNQLVDEIRKGSTPFPDTGINSVN